MSETGTTRNDWPESVHKVMQGLAERGPVTNKDLLDATGLGRRTLYRALRRLMDHGIVQRKPSLRDARTAYFVLDERVRERPGAEN